MIALVEAEGRRSKYGPGKLPNDDELARLHKAGESIKDIAARYGASYEAVRRRLKAAGIEATRAAPRYDLPWRARADHRQQAVIQHWYAWRRREMGQSRSEAEAVRVDQWLTFMEGRNPRGVPLSIYYDRTTGFWLRPQRVGDELYLSVD
jgi:hypothetical protein